MSDIASVGRGTGTTDYRSERPLGWSGAETMRPERVRTSGSGVSPAAHRAIHPRRSATAPKALQEQGPPVPGGCRATARPRPVTEVAKASNEHPCPFDAQGPSARSTLWRHTGYRTPRASDRRRPAEASAGLRLTDRGRPLAVLSRPSPLPLRRPLPIGPETGLLEHCGSRQPPGPVKEPPAGGTTS